MSLASTNKKIKHKFTTKYNDSEPVVCQTKNRKREMQQQDQEKTNFEQVPMC